MDRSWGMPYLSSRISKHKTQEIREMPRRQERPLAGPPRIPNPQRPGRERSDRSPQAPSPARPLNDHGTVAPNHDTAPLDSQALKEAKPGGRPPTPRPPGGRWWPAEPPGCARPRQRCRPGRAPAPQRPRRPPRRPAPRSARRTLPSKVRAQGHVSRCRGCVCVRVRLDRDLVTSRVCPSYFRHTFLVA